MSIKNIQNRLLNIAISFDQMCWSLITLGAGHPDETISSATYRHAQKNKKLAIVAEKCINWIFQVIVGQRDHCYQSYLSEKNRDQFPDALK